MPIDQANDI